LVVVGAAQETVSGLADAGNAYTFNATTGALVATLANPGPQSGGQFGASVAISGAIAVVGTEFYTVSGVTYAGRAYVFNATSGSLLATLDSPKLEKDGHFGWSVAINRTSIVVGAPFLKSGGVASAGQAFVFNATTDSLVSTLKPSSPQTSGEFGYSVAISGDLVAVGAPGESVGGIMSAGSAEVFKSTNGAFVSSSSSPNAIAGGAFGYSVAISGSVMSVGAPYETATGYTEAGNAYNIDPKTAVLISSMSSPNAMSGGEFGYSVAIAGTTVVVGAPDETVSSNTEAGNAYIWTSAGVLTATIRSANPQFYGTFGLSVSVSGEIEVVGAPYEIGDGYSGAGNAYIF
jgi:hypothetical protein